MAFVKAANLSDVPQGRLKVFEVGDEDIALANVEGEIFAVANVCTHDDGPLGEGYLFDDEVECPRHGARFCLKTGEVLCAPAFEDIDSYPVRVRNGRIEVFDEPQ